MKVKRFKSIKGLWFVVMIFVLGLVVSSSPSFAARDTLGNAIQAKAKMVKLDNNKVVHGEKNGKKITFTSANLENVKSLNDIEQGQVIGVLESKITGYKTNLSPKKYNVFLKKINGEWKTYAEFNGRVVAEATRVTVEENGKKDLNLIYNLNGEVQICISIVFVTVCYTFNVSTASF